MAGPIRPRSLAAAFGAYFLVISLASWGYAQSLTSAWYPADITRWVYTTYMLIAAIFLVGLGGLGLSVRRAFMKQIHDLDRRVGPTPEMPEALPPPLPEPGVKDHVDRDIDELLESLSEIEASTAKEAAAMEVLPEAVSSANPGGQAAVVQRERLMQRSKFLGRYVIGPGVVAAIILGISGFMLPASDGFAQAPSTFTLNTAFILGIGYSWLGLGGYIAATVYALSSVKHERKKR